MRKNIILLAGASLLASCCDDEATPMDIIPECPAYLTEPIFLEDDTTFRFCNDCIDFSPCEELSHEGIRFDYYYTCFNPANPNQIAYYRYDNSKFQSVFDIWTLDLCTGEQRKLTDNGYYGLDWGINGWLLYTSPDQNIWKIKSNGDSLTQLTFEGAYNRYPKWDPKGERIAFQRQSVGTLSILIICDANGFSLDTIEQLNSIGSWSWIDEHRICYLVTEPNTSPTVTKLKYYDMNIGKVQFLHDFTVGLTLDSLVLSTASFLEENSLLLVAIGFVGQVDLNTGNFKIIREAFRQEWFQENISYHPASGQILFNNRIIHNVDECTVDSEYGLFLMDKYGMNERRVLIPEG